MSEVRSANVSSARFARGGRRAGAFDMRVHCAAGRALLRARKIGGQQNIQLKPQLSPPAPFRISIKCSRLAPSRRRPDAESAQRDDKMREEDAVHASAHPPVLAFLRLFTKSIEEGPRLVFREKNDFERGAVQLL